MHTQKNHSDVKSGREPAKLVSLWLDDYDNIFSDFDPRSFSQRTLSDDFLEEAEKVAHTEKNELIQLMILMPAGKRNSHDENIIKKRLHAHFRHEFGHLAKERSAYLKRGFLFTVVGFLIMFAAAYMASSKSESLYFNFMRVILEPSGWFMVWYGLDNVFYLSRSKYRELRFNKMMVKAEIVFDSYQPRT